MIEIKVSSKGYLKLLDAHGGLWQALRHAPVTPHSAAFMGPDKTINGAATWVAGSYAQR